MIPVLTKPARGMTLLEVLIATPILASLTVIVATLWTQTKQWTDEAADHGAALRLQRALDLLDRQWESRLMNATLVDGETGVVRVDDARLEFITTESVLFADWPIVRAAYIATPTDDIAGAEPSWRLVYEETRLGTVSADGATAADAARDATTHATTHTTFDEINMRRATLVDLTGRPAWSAVLTDAQIAELESASTGATAGPATAPEDSAEPDRPRWINLTTGTDRKWAGLESATNPESVRLDGKTTEGGFQWALVGRPLR